MSGWTSPEVAHSEIVVVTCAHERDGTESVTLFDLQDSSKSGALHGEMIIVSSKTGASRVGDMLNRMLTTPPRRRIYYYGDELQNVNIRKLVEGSVREFIRRSPHRSRDLFTTNERLERLDNRRFVEEELTVVNGLPEDSQAVASMGPLAGNVADWIDFRNKVVETLSGRKAQMVTSREGFIRDLTQGESDVIVLVAHSTGAFLYLNGERMSIEDLKALPPRETPSRRARLAVLVSCETGKPTSQEPRWRNRLRKETAPLAQLLVEKQYVDKVVAPDHNIRVEESLIVLQRALEGARTTSIFKDWINWAAVKRGLREFLG